MRRLGDVVLNDELLGFIRGSLRSVWALELLLLLRRNRDRRWTSDQLVQEMRASGAIVRQSLQELQAAGLVACEQDDTCVYAPASPVLDELSGRLDEAYRQRPVGVVNAILKAPKGTLQTFADAFRIKGKGDPDD